MITALIVIGCLLAYAGAIAWVWSIGRAAALGDQAESEIARRESLDEL